LKIDRSFVRDVNDDASDAAIVRTIIEMAHTLGFSVVPRASRPRSRRRICAPTAARRRKAFCSRGPCRQARWRSPSCQGLPESKSLDTLDAVATAFQQLIIVLTSNEDPGLRDRAMAHGAYDLLRKGSTGATALERVLRVATVQAGTVRTLRDSEARYRKTFELAGSGIAHVDLDGRFLRVNRKLCEILGYPEAELVGSSVRELSHPEDRSREPEAVRTEKRFVRKDGSIVWVEETVAPVHDAAGRPQYEISVIEDITERKQIEARQAAHTRFQE